MVKFVYYSAKWCEPCKRIRPWVESAARKFGADLEIRDIDQGIVEGILSVPTLDVAVQGETVKRISQWSNASALAREIQEVL